MSHIPKLLNAFSKLFSYPDEHTAQTAELLFVVLQSELPEAASEASEFGAFVEQHELWEVEETFTHTFDVNPSCALEVGWHLFGEEYARGMFLVRMREELRKYELPESGELPDHISHVLAIVAAMPEDEARRFVRACVQPAIGKMNQAFIGKDKPYGHVITCLTEFMNHTWGENPQADGQSAAPGTRPFESDPLRAFPVADVGCGSGCGSSCEDDVEIIPLHIDFSTTAKQSNPPTPFKVKRP